MSGPGCLSNWLTWEKIGESEGSRRLRRKEDIMGKRRFLVWFMAAVMAFGAFALAGCGKSSEQVIREGLEADIDEAMKKIDGMMDEMVDSMSDEESETFEKMGVDFEGALKGIFDDMKLEIGEIEVDEKAGTATAELLITEKSMTKLNEEFTKRANELAQNASSMTTLDELYKEGGKIFKEVLDSLEPETRSIEMTLTRKDGEWDFDDVEFEKSLSEAVMGE